MNVFSQSPNGAEGGEYGAVTLAFACGAGGGNGKHEGDLTQEYCRCYSRLGGAVELGSNFLSMIHYPPPRKICRMARFHLSTFKSARLIPIEV